MVVSPLLLNFNEFFLIFSTVNGSESIVSKEKINERFRSFTQTSRGCQKKVNV